MPGERALTVPLRFQDVAKHLTRVHKGIVWRQSPVHSHQNQCRMRQKMAVAPAPERRAQQLLGVSEHLLPRRFFNKNTPGCVGLL